VRFVFEQKFKRSVADDTSYWRKLNPGLSIGSAAKSARWEPKKYSQREAQRIRETLIPDAYFSIPDFLSKLRIQKMHAAVNTIRNEGWPIPFVFVYDIFWQAPRRMQLIVGDLLGEDFRMLPDFWAWFIDHRSSGRGWRKHRDRNADCIDENGLPQSLTVWIALSDATADNGCIHCLPASKDPRYRIEFSELNIEQPEDIRALECDAGTLLAWNQVLLHWGGRARPSAKNSRVSFAYEFQRKEVAAHNLPLLDPMIPPSFEQRLALIAKQVLQYQHMHLISDEICDVAEWLVKSCELPPTT
jgi:hypothetical protein